MQQKKGWLGGHFFRTRVRRVHVFLSLNGVFIVELNYHIKASVKLIEFVRENQIIHIPSQGLTNTVLQKSWKHTVVMKNMINTIGKKIHTLVKENTSRRHKLIRRECGFTQKFTFFYRSLCFLPHCCANICTEVRLMLPNTYTYQEIYDTHTCLNFSKTCQNVRL